MQHDEIAEISKLRIENAKRMLSTAQSLIELEDYKSSANRSYYAIFNAMRAVLALLQIDNKKHSGLISDFRLHFIKTGIFDVELSDIITGLFEVRTQSDYNDFFIISKEEIVTQVKNAEKFLSAIEKHLVDKEII